MRDLVHYALQRGISLFQLSLFERLMRVCVKGIQVFVEIAVGGAAIYADLNLQYLRLCIEVLQCRKAYRDNLSQSFTATLIKGCLTVLSDALAKYTSDSTLRTCVLETHVGDLLSELLISRCWINADYSISDENDLSEMVRLTHSILFHGSSFRCARSCAM